MNPIPAWVRRLWDIWDLRMLVLLSFTLQIILSIFGSRRKYISATWISVLVWSAYILADWVATVVLGKLSDAQGNQENINALWVIWAPLLLLHLGGPDTITAYSLEDNRLWLRHFMGLVVQLSVAVYVILMSWKKSWFSFMSIPALVAGIIKYGERTLAFYWGSNEKYSHRMPFRIPGLAQIQCHGCVMVQVVGPPSIEGELCVPVPEDLPIVIEGHKYVLVPVGPPSIEGQLCVPVPEDNPLIKDHYDVRVLAWAVIHLANLMAWLDGSITYEWTFMPVVDSYLLDAMEVSMGLMYDLLYTKAAAIYSKGGIIMRCISFGCTVFVLLGLAIQTLLLKTKEGEEIDTLITWVLIVGAVALEIYAAIVIISSNWTMLWLIIQGKEEWVMWLRQRFSGLFKKKKNWSNKVGQFDILGYLFKETDDVQSPVRKIFWSVLGPTYEEKWDRYRYGRYRYKTADAVHRPVYDTILPLCRLYCRGGILNSSILRELNEIWAKVAHSERGDICEFSEEKTNTSVSAAIILDVHLVTEIVYHLEMDWDAAGSEDDPSRSDRDVSKILSDYMMYLLVMHPSLLPNAGSRRSLELDLQRLRQVFTGNERGVKAACLRLQEIDGWNPRIGSGVEYLKGKEKKERWEIIKVMWLKMLYLATYDHGGFGQKDSHFQQLRKGGELLTLIWFFNPFR